LCHAQVDDVAILQIDFGRRSRSFENYQLILSSENLVARADKGEKFLIPALEIVFCRELREDLSPNDDLRGRVTGGLEEHWIHVDGGRNARGFRLQGLCATDLEPFRSGSGVQ
jgi:hypothetical protein